jgi:hypothetical protein
MLGEMESDEVFREYRERQRRLQERMEEVRVQTDAILEAMAQEVPAVASATALDALRREGERLAQEYMARTGSFIEYLRELEKARREAEVAEKPSRPPRSQANIEQLSKELSTNLRLERVDDAIKELLDFLADAEFFAANASTGRKRRLRSLQNALEKALAK